jgi:hypothetical protein
LPLLDVAELARVVQGGDGGLHEGEC